MRRTNGWSDVTAEVSDIRPIENANINNQSPIADKISPAPDIRECFLNFFRFVTISCLFIINKIKLQMPWPIAEKKNTVQKFI